MNCKLFCFLLAALFCAIGAHAQTASVQFIHNSPDMALATVDVWLNDSLWADNVDYHQATPMTSVDTNSTAMWEIRNSEDAELTYYSWSSNLNLNSKHIFVMHGHWSSELYNPSQLLAVEQFNSALESSASTANIDVLFFQGASELDTVDIAETQLFQLTAFDQLPYGEFSPYINLFTADYGWSILNSDGDESFGEYALPVTSLNWAGKAITIVTSGFINQAENNLGHPLGMWATTSDGGQMECLQPLQWNITTNVQFIHNSSAGGSENIRIETDSVMWLSSLDQHSASPFLAFPAGKDVELQIHSNLLGGLNDSIEYHTVHFFSGRKYQLIWFGGSNPENEAKLLVREWEETPTLSSNQMLLRLFNGSPQTNFIHLLTDTLSQNVLFDNIPYGGMSDTTSTNIINEEWILTSETDSITAFHAPLDTLGLELRNVTALTFSDATHPTPSMWLCSEVGGPMQRLYTLSIPEYPVYCNLQLVHASADTLMQSIDVWINDSLVASPLLYESTCPFFDIQCNDSLVIVITPHNQPLSVLHTDTIELAANQIHRLFLWGILDSQNYNPAPALNWVTDLETPLQSTIDGSCDIRFFHAATDVGTIDVHETVTPFSPLFNEISTGQFSLSQNLTPQTDYQIELRNSPTQFLYGSYTLPALSYNWENEVITLISTGFRQPANNSNGSAFRLWAMTSDGTMILLDNTLSADQSHQSNRINVFPNPAADVLYMQGIANNFEKGTLRILNSKGQLVLEKELDDWHSLNIQTIDISNLINGFYTLTVSDDSRIIHQPFCVRK